MKRQHTPSSRAPAEALAKTSRALRVVLGTLVFGTAVLGASGCVARATARTQAVVEYEEPVVVVETVPVEIESYPRHVYRGTYVYLVDGRWYYQARGHWVVYSVEPRALASVRVSYEAKFGRHYRPSVTPQPHHRHHPRDKG